MRISRLDPGMALLPLRLFLGITFTYAGVQKLSDPGFLHKGSVSYIGTQLHEFANHTPGGFLLRAFALPHPELAGVVVAMVEITIGVCAFAGLFTRAAAVVGFGLSTILFLTASWRTSPYFLGSDIVFMFAWLPFVLSGENGQLALDHELARRRVRRVRVRRNFDDIWWGRQGPTTKETVSMTRREALGGGAAAVGTATLLISAVSALAKGSYRPPKPLSRTESSGKSASSGIASRSRKPSVPSNAIKLGASSRLPRDQAAYYTDPTDGQPDLIIRHADGSLTAMSSVCTHAGCRVDYQGGVVRCPCHGAVYNAETGAVEGGPAPQGLALKRVVERSGSIYAVPE